MTDHLICIFPPPGSLKFGEGPDRFGKVWRWEFHEYLGPGFLRKNGELLKNQPSENSPAWDPFYDWFYNMYPEKDKFPRPHEFHEDYKRQGEK
jgi:hypothetical protein